MKFNKKFIVEDSFLIWVAIIMIFLLFTRDQLKHREESYLSPSIAGVRIIPLISAGEKALNGYRMAGAPDGLGTMDNNDGTFTVFINHEINEDQGVQRAHRAEGAFISQWIITKPLHEKPLFTVLSGSDLIRNLYLWDNSVRNYTNHGDIALARLCSADLAPVSAYYDPKKDLGTKERIYLTGEENDLAKTAYYGRALATVASGPNKGRSFDLPHMGRMAFENLAASPFPQTKTIVVALDDAAGQNWDTLGEVYVYIGEKQKVGIDIGKAGLTNGRLYAIGVDGLKSEDPAYGLPPPDMVSRRFSLRDQGRLLDDDGTKLFHQTQLHNILGSTKFFRPEDGAWDTIQNNQFYFTTTGASFMIKNKGKEETIQAPGRLWLLKFDDIKNPEQGGEIFLILNGNEGITHPDNITITPQGLIYIQEDPGESTDLARIWQYNPKNNQLTEVAHHNPLYFGKWGTDFITFDEESSGIIDMSPILGEGWLLATVQSHIRFNEPHHFFNRWRFGFRGKEGEEIVEDGQLCLIYVPPELR